MNLSGEDQHKLQTQLARTIECIEELLQAGLTTASQATQQTLAVTFQEASRLKLLRLGATLRATCEEIGRYIKDEPGFSNSRLMFFVNRSWLVCKGLQRALENHDVKALDNLLWNAPASSVNQVNVICLGVTKKVAVNSFCAFEFRLRDIDSGQPLSWSTVFPMSSGSEIPAEGYLHLPQKQKFKAAVFLEQKVLTIHQLMLSQPQSGPARIQLTDHSQVVAGPAYRAWDAWLQWNRKASLERVRGHQVSPFDVDIELQEEVVFHNYALASSNRVVDERKIYQLKSENLEVDIVVPNNIEGEATEANLQRLLKLKVLPPLYGLMHFAQSRLIVQPLSVLNNGKLEYCTISDKAIDRKSLLAALKFN